MTGHGGNIHLASRVSGIPIGRILDFSASINPLGLARSAADAIRKSLGLLSHYPEPDAGSLALCLARHYRLSPASLISGNGSTELIYLIPRVLEPSRVLIAVPTFSEYSRACRNGNATEIRRLHLRPENQFALDPEEFIRAMKGCDIAFLCNPNNPTGRLLRKRDVLEIAGEAEKLGCYLVVDEAFMDFCQNETVMHNVRRNPYLIVLRSLTKFYALAGLRIGFGVFSPGVAVRMNSYKEPWTVNSLADAAAKAVLRDSDYRLRSLTVLGTEKRYLEKGLSKTGITFTPSAANYYLIRLEDAKEAARRLAGRGILVRDCSNFEGLDGSYIRIAVRSRKENSVLLKELAKLCAE